MESDTSGPVTAALIHFGPLNDLLHERMDTLRPDIEGANCPLLYIRATDRLYLPVTTLTLPFSLVDPMDGDNLEGRLGEVPPDVVGANDGVEILEFGEAVFVWVPLLLRTFRFWAARLPELTPLYSADELEAVVAMVPAHIHAADAGKLAPATRTLQ